MCLFTALPTPVQAPSPTICPAKLLGPCGRQELALQALAGAVPVSALAREADVSRKFVYRQKSIAAEALGCAFDPPPDNGKVLFYLPVTELWLRQFVLSLVLICHSSLRGVVEMLRDCFDFDISLGKVHGIVDSAVETARRINDEQDLANVRVGAHDEIFQHRQPVLVGVDAETTYCYLLGKEEHRDGDTWGVRLLDLQKRGLNPDTFIGDAGSGLRAGLKAAFPDAPCRSDVFHALQKFQEVASTLENKAYRSIDTCVGYERQIARSQRRMKPADRSSIARLRHAAEDRVRDIQLADDIAELARWLRHDILAMAGPGHNERLALYDFLVGELETRRPLAPYPIQPLVTYLKSQRDGLLDFAAQLDRDFAALGAQYQVDPETVRDLFAPVVLEDDDPRRWYRDGPLRRTLGERYLPLSRELEAVRRRTVRASSVVENLNSRLRDYFFLRQNVNAGYLTLLQFFLNHRRFQRSEHPERVGKSPAELLTGQTLPHWLEQLGYKRFSAAFIQN